MAERDIWACKVSPYEEINKVVWYLFVKARAKGVHLSGPVVQTKALDFAKKIGITGFKASNGWFEAFKTRHNVVYNRGEVNVVDVQFITKWKDKSGIIINSYEAKDIYNEKKNRNIF